MHKPNGVAKDQRQQLQQAQYLYYAEPVLMEKD